jgi:KDO2-lipid IV(A) lauroyltransferase
LTAVALLGVLLKRRSGRAGLWPWLAVLIVTLACFAVVYLSPGNEIRAADFPLRHDLARSVTGSLSVGNAVALLLDQNPAWYEGVFVPFFNEIACTNKALSTIALRTGSPVIPAFNVRQPDGSYQVFCEPEIVLGRSGDTTRDIEENTAKFNKIIETYVRRYPEQWFWVHQRWKTRPYQPWPREL